jgi:hypothetical protein
MTTITGILAIPGFRTRVRSIDFNCSSHHTLQPLRGNYSFKGRIGAIKVLSVGSKGLMHLSFGIMENFDTYCSYLRFHKMLVLGLAIVIPPFYSFCGVAGGVFKQAEKLRGVDFTGK